jgi:hypothetical protein
MMLKELDRSGNGCWPSFAAYSRWEAGHDLPNGLVVLGSVQN